MTAEDDRVPVRVRAAVTAKAVVAGRGQRRQRASLALRVVERNARLALHYRLATLGRLVEPFLFLFSLGLGLGALVDEVTGPGGETVAYSAFVAPAILATSAMGTAVFAATIEFFARFKWVGSVDAMLATPIGVRDLVRGELAWIAVLVAVQSTSFTVAMVLLGLVASWWGVLLVPAAVVVGTSFACAGLVASTWFRTWLDFDYVSLATVPMILFSASYFPLDRYPDTAATVVSLTPMYHGVALCRNLALGTVGWPDLVSVAYLVLFGRLALTWADRRLPARLQP